MVDLGVVDQLARLDSPAHRLDPRARRMPIELLRSFQHTRIIATHDLDLVLERCNLEQPLSWSGEGR